jgi:1-acyl-sn-glycerol-3-phosphate acyltransferase
MDLHPSGNSAFWNRPPDEEVRRVLNALLPWEFLTSPYFSGLENVEQGGSYLFAGNHTIAGVLDAPLMMRKLFMDKEIFLRSLGDHMHFKIPVWREFLSRYGVVDGNRDNCARLMKSRQSILLFPGGSREVAKRRGEKYQLIWKQRLGFAKMAIEHGFPIIPFSAVGAEEAYDIVLDGNDMMKSPLGPYIEKAGIRKDMLMPLIKGLGPTPIPRPVRMYFHFSPPIETARFEGRAEDEEALWIVRKEVEEAVAAGIEKLLQHREEDPEQELMPRLLRGFQRKFFNKGLEDD